MSKYFKDNKVKYLLSSYLNKYNFKTKTKRFFDVNLGLFKMKCWQNIKGGQMQLLLHNCGCSLDGASGLDS